MRTFTCLFTDDRYSLGTLALPLTDSEQRALELASRELIANPHYRGFEVSEGARPILLRKARA